MLASWRARGRSCSQAAGPQPGGFYHQASSGDSLLVCCPLNALRAELDLSSLGPGHMVREGNIV